MQDFWRGDVAGLYGLAGSDGLPLKLIELSVAAAADRPSRDYALPVVRADASVEGWSKLD